MTGTAILKSMIPLKVQTPLPSYRTGTVSAGGTHQGKKKKKENLTTHPLKLVHQSPKGIITEKSLTHTYVPSMIWYFYFQGSFVRVHLTLA